MGASVSCTETYLPSLVSIEQRLHGLISIYNLLIYIFRG